MKNKKRIGKITPPMIEYYRRVIGDLTKRFPAAFNKSFPVPLEVGVHNQIEKLTGLSEKEVSVLLTIWTRRYEYKCMAASVGHRFDLNGNRVGKIADGEMVGFINAIPLTKKKNLTTFCKAYLKATGQPPLIFVPIKDRPILNL